MTTPEQFTKRLDRLHAVITNGLWCHRAWEYLFVYEAGKRPWELADLTGVVNSFPAYFGPARFALQTAGLLAFAKAFDTHAKAASIPNLLKAAFADPSLIPHASPGDLQSVSAALLASRGPLTTLRKLRNQELAHVDAAPSPLNPLMKVEFNIITMHARESYNTLSYAHRKMRANWKTSIEQVDHDSSNMFSALIEDHNVMIARQAQLIAATRQ